MQWHKLKKGFMKKYSSILIALIIGAISFATSCSDSDDNGNKEPNVNVGEGGGPSSSDVLTIPSGSDFMGDSIQQVRTFSLSANPVKKVIASTTQSGHIAVMGGYKDNSAVYVYAKVDDDSKLTDDEITALLNKYYDIVSEVSGTEIKAIVTEKSIAHGSDYRKLRVSIKIFTPGDISTQLSIKYGSIFVDNVNGGEHVATSESGSIKYLNSFGKNFTAHSTTGHVAFINTTASESINAKLSKGNIQFAVPSETKTSLDLKSLTNVTASVLNSSNFTGTNTRTVVKGDLNGGGYKTNAEIGTGSIVFRWYNNKY